MGRTIKIALILGSIGIVVAAAVATALTLYFKRKTDPIITSNNTTVQQSTTMSVFMGANVSTNRVNTTMYDASRTTGITNPSTTLFSTISSTRASTTQAAAVSNTVSQYSSALTISSQTFCRGASCLDASQYFEAFRLTVLATGLYSMKSSGSLDTYGYLYSGTFDPFNPTANLVTSNDDDGGSRQFMMNATLQASVQYIIVVTSYYTFNLGSYTVTITGPGSVAPSLLNITGLTTQRSLYSSTLNNTSATFCRVGNCSDGLYYYYIALRLNVSTNGTYYIVSYSNVDTYGYIYNSSFIASAPDTNFLISNDNSAGYGAFLLSTNISPISTYVLVVTTYWTNVTGPYAVIAYGKGTVSFSIG
ncbi:unnamed protein product [Adineta ricciae]|uniref:Uncharacterized protein n=1 Tax=Adineta ricciae TaxID=249248 RepID=A0A814G0N2_ADIRI|nr:unnamed protein product [Adineta ricciae]CAF1021038.1 unnamed protein product [Adineta ricciae]